MERLTRPDINVNPGTDRFLHAVIGGKEIDWKQSRDSTLNVMINGEDTGLTPEGIKAPFTEDTMVNLAAQALGVEADRLRELAEADKDGRCVVLPCNGYSDIEIVRNGISYKPAHWDIHLTTFAHGQNTPSGIKVGLFDIGEVERALREIQGKEDADGATDKPE